MKIVNFLNPQRWLGQIAILAVFFLLGVSLTLWHHECPPSIQVSQNIKNKSKKGSSIVNDNIVKMEDVSCEEWLKSLSQKEIRQIKKQ